MSGELISVTLYFGPQPPKGLETSVFEALENTRKWKKADGALLLLDGDAVLASFSFQKTEP
jgi:hypothetical protein